MGNLFYAAACKCFCMTELVCVSTPERVDASATTCFKIVLLYGYGRRD